MIPLFKVYMAAETSVELAKVLHSGQITQGPQVELFEKKLAEYLDSPWDLLTVNSCTSALELALYLAGAGPETEVITTAMTCSATNGAIVRSGATPVFVDVDPATGLISPMSIRGSMTDRTVAIVAVDWAGQPCAYDALRMFSPIPIIQDAAHSFGALYKGSSLARLGGDYVCWSFQAIKHVTTGDGGLLKVPKSMVERARKLRWFGLDRSVPDRFQQNIHEIGFKMHMNDLAATIGLANLGSIKSVLAIHRDNAEYFHEKLGNIRGIGVPRPNKDAAWWFYPLIVNNRDGFQRYITERKVFEVSQVHKRNDHHSAFAAFGPPREPLTGLEYFSQHQIAIPCGWWVGRVEREAIVKEIVKWSKEN